MKILTYHIDDFISEYDSIAEKLNWHCKQSSYRWRLDSVCQRFNEIFFLLTERESQLTSEYLIKEVKASTSAELTDEIMSHWQTHHNTKGIIQISEKEFLAVYEKELI